MTALLLQLAAEEGHHGNVMLETLPALIIPAVAFIMLGLVTYSYKNVANRHAGKAEAYAAANPQDAHGAGR